MWGEKTVVEMQKSLHRFASALFPIPRIQKSGPRIRPAFMGACWCGLLGWLPSQENTHPMPSGEITVSVVNTGRGWKILLTEVLGPLLVPKISGNGESKLHHLALYPNDNPYLDKNWFPFHGRFGLPPAQDLISGFSSIGLSVQPLEAITMSWEKETSCAK